MAVKALRRYPLENIARILIAVGLLFVLLAWAIGAYFSGITGRWLPSLIVPSIFTCVLAIMLAIIRYRYTLFEKYPYLMNLPSIFYRPCSSTDSSRKLYVNPAVL